MLVLRNEIESEKEKSPEKNEFPRALFGCVG
jgi:hypothetical protein